MNLHKISFTELLINGIRAATVEEVLHAMGDFKPKISREKLLSINADTGLSVSYDKIANKKFEIYSNGAKITFNGIVIKQDNSANLRKDILRSGNILVSNSFIGEGLINMILSELFTNGVTPHLLVSFGLSRENIIMEYCDWTLPDFAHKFYTAQKQLDSAGLDAIMIGVLHTLMITYERFKFVHFDLHENNLIFKEFTGPDAYFQGKSGRSIKYFQYNLGPDVFYLPNPGFIVKIIDYGYSAIKVGKSTIISGGNDVKKSLLSFYPGYLLPTNSAKTGYKFYNYDIFRNIIYYFGLCGSSIAKELITTVPVISDLPADYHYNKTYNKDFGLSMTPREILMMKVFNKYRIRPKDITFDNSIIIGMPIITGTGADKLSYDIDKYNLPIICKAITISNHSAKAFPFINLKPTKDKIVIEYVYYQMYWYLAGLKKMPDYKRLAAQFYKLFAIEFDSAVVQVNTFLIAKYLQIPGHMMSPRIINSLIEIITFLREHKKLYNTIN